MENISTHEQSSLVSQTSIANIGAEKSVLSAILTDNDVLMQISEILKPNHFFNSGNREIYAAMLEIYNKNVIFDTVLLKEHLEATGKLELVGGVGYLFEIQEDIPPLNLIPQYADMIVKKSMIREFLTIVSNAYGQAKDNSDMFQKTVDELQMKIIALNETRQKKDYKHIGVLLKETLSTFTLNEDPEGYAGVITGIRELDIRTSGLKKGNLIVLAARPSVGKTAFALTIALNAAKNKKRVGFLSIEMSEQEVSLRLLSSVSGLNSRDINRCFLNNQQTVPLLQAVSTLYEYPIFVDDNSSMTIMQIRNVAKKLKIKENIDLLIIDYLQLISVDGKFDNRNTEIAFISRSLKGLARELDIPVLVLSQLSRSVESRADRRPMLSDLRDSGAIEQDADVVLFIYREVMYIPDTENPENTEIIIGKQRNGPTGSFCIRYIKETTLFTDW